MVKHTLDLQKKKFFEISEVKWSYINSIYYTNNVVVFCSLDCVSMQVRVKINP